MEQSHEKLQGALVAWMGQSHEKVQGVAAALLHFPVASLVGLSHEKEGAGGFASLFCGFWDGTEPREGALRGLTGGATASPVGTAVATGISLFFSSSPEELFEGFGFGFGGLQPVCAEEAL